jgi:hypothetical protein
MSGGFVTHVLPHGPRPAVAASAPLDDPVLITEDLRRFFRLVAEALGTKMFHYWLSPGFANAGLQHNSGPVAAVLPSNHDFSMARAGKCKTDRCAKYLR